jgi:hypothetical protein
MFRARTAAVATLCAVTLAGCTGSSGPEPQQTPTTTSSSPSPSPTLTAAQQLQQLARLGTKAVYRANYRVRQRHPSSHATWRVWRTNTSLRVDVVTKHATATLIQGPHNTFACSRSGHRKRCFRVANGKSIPAPLHLLAEQLFSANMTSLAKGAPQVTVAIKATGPPFGTCFTVTPRHKSSSIAKGEYCFDESGVLTRVRYPNGNQVVVLNINDHKPDKQVFRPYASPTPLPG